MMLHAQRRDRGAVLPIVLVVIFVLGVLVVAIARFGTANLRFGRVAEARSDQLAAADAAMSYAVNLIRVNRADCIFTNSSVQLPPIAETFNGATGEVTCTPVSGGLDNAGLFAMAITGEGVDPAAPLADDRYIINTQGGSKPKILGGPVYMQRVDTDAFDLANNAGIAIEDAPLIHYDASSPCVAVPEASLPDDVEFRPDAVFGPLCTEDAWDDYGPDGDTFDEPPIGDPDFSAQWIDAVTPASGGNLPIRDGGAALTGTPVWTSMPLTSADPNQIVTVEGAYTDEGPGTCRVFEPGRYITPPILNETNAYFKSGDYIFDFRDQDDLAPASLEDLALADDVVERRFDIFKATVTAGRLDHPIITTTEIDNTDCEPYFETDPADPVGATFYVGGNGFIEIRAQGGFEIMPRNQADPADPPEYIAVHALCTSTPLVTDSWCNAPYGPDIAGSNLTAPWTTASPAVVFSESGVNRQMVVNGLIWAPLAEIELSNVTGSAEMRLRGGVVVARATLQASTSAENFQIGVGAQDIQIGLRLLATGTDTDGGVTQISSLVDYAYGEEAGSAVDIISYRVCEKDGC